MLSALEDCIEGYESLHRQAGVLHCDISSYNLMVNEDDLTSPRGFLIDLDLAIKEEQSTSRSGARGKVDTRAFMAIGVLLGEERSFMHDLGSFFWVLFWICIHYDGSGREFDSWHCQSDNDLVRSKIGTIGDESELLRDADENFTPFYRPLLPWVNRLRKVFPNDEARSGLVFGNEKNSSGLLFSNLQAASEHEETLPLLDNFIHVRRVASGL